MKYKILYTQKAIKDLQKIEKQEAQKIISKIKFFCEDKNPLKHTKPLVGYFKGLYRFRIGNYRAIFKKNSNGQLILLTILIIKHRKDIYFK